MAIRWAWLVWAAYMSVELSEWFADYPDRLPAGDFLRLLFCLPLPLPRRRRIRTILSSRLLPRRSLPPPQLRRTARPAPPLPPSSSSSSGLSSDGDDDDGARDAPDEVTSAAP